MVFKLIFYCLEMAEYCLVQDSEYQHLKTEDKKAIVKGLKMYDFGDIVDTSIIDGGMEFCNNFPTYKLKLHCENLNNYDRFNEMPKEQLKILAKDIIKHHHLSIFKKRQVLEELVALQNAQKKILNEGKFDFPKVSQREMNWASFW